jgi:serine/threonine-protein kinase
LEGYYERHWRQMQGGDRDRWVRTLLPVISVLAVAREPLTMEEIVKFVRRGFPEFGLLAAREVRAIVNQWRPFLAQTIMEHRVCYRIYHNSFREFLASKEDVEESLGE